MTPKEKQQKFYKELVDEMNKYDYLVYVGEFDIA